MRIILLFVVLLLSYGCFGNKKVDQTIHGTFIYGAICKDGIVFIADSRANFNDNGKSMFYIDGIKKIFVINNYIIAFAGEIRIKDKFPGYYLGRLEKMEIKSPIDLIIKYTNILKNELGEKEYNTQIDDLVIIAGGYENEKPIICGLRNNKILYSNQGSITNQGFSRSNSELDKLNFKKTIRLLKKDVKKFVTQNNLENEIGGPITVIKIRENQLPKCLKNCNNITWCNWQEMKNYMLNNIDSLTKTNCKNNQEVISVLNKYKD